MKKLLTLAAFAALSTSVLADVELCGSWKQEHPQVCATQKVVTDYTYRTYCYYDNARSDRENGFYTVVHEGNVECREYTKDDQGRPVWLEQRVLDRKAIFTQVTDKNNCKADTRNIWVPRDC